MHLESRKSFENSFTHTLDKEMKFLREIFPAIQEPLVADYLETFYTVTFLIYYLSNEIFFENIVFYSQQATTTFASSAIVIIKDSFLLICF